MWTIDHPGERFENWLKLYPHLKINPRTLFQQSHAICFVGGEEANLWHYLAYSLPLALCDTAVSSGEFKACGHCQGCISLRRLGSDRFCQLMPTADQIFLGQARQFVADMINSKASELRVGLILSPELLRTEAANCLLKFIEEPPPNRVLLLYATTSRPILPTIRSRLVCVNLPSAAPVFHKDEQAIGQVLQYNLACESGMDVPEASSWAQIWSPVMTKLQEQLFDIESRRDQFCPIEEGSRLHHTLVLKPLLCPIHGWQRFQMVRRWLSHYSASDALSMHLDIIDLKTTLEGLAQQATSLMNIISEQIRKRYQNGLRHPLLGDFKDTAHPYCRGFVLKNADLILGDVLRAVNSASDSFARPVSASSQLSLHRKVAEVRQMVYNHFPLDTAFTLLSSWMLYEHEL